ncbi:NUDIX hydrolase [Oribacterium sp. WCC10]|uniref:NUDIX hydrolase n=1 Tax=Oribacterium sp. WCC10 TaxID=1855343 RepID=UPI0008E5EE59|nr:NUDIX hydrolase [Oribacterium sp. WCC10]SFG29692.1 ADP-ribose pyrophosphatase YjhB, NUDIX family [Oribacterium sp. WCC10]
MSQKIEYMDIYNDKKERTGRIADRKTPLKKGEFMMYVLAILERPSDGRMLITRRALDKKWAAGAWEIPGGASMAGESSFDAVVREVQEETGLDVTVCPMDQRTPIYSYMNEDLERGDNYFVDIYHFIFPFNENDVNIQKSEAIDHRFATIDEITGLNKNSEFLHYKRLLQALNRT